MLKLNDSIHSTHAVKFVLWAVAMLLSSGAHSQARSENDFRVKLASGETTVGVKSLKEIDWSKAIVKDCPNPACNVDVKVTFDPPTGPNRKCVWEFPHLIVVKHRNAVITWTLTGSDETAFSDQGEGAGTGIDIKPDHVYKRHYGNPKNTGRSFSWERNDKGLRMYAYELNVSPVFFALP